MRILAIMGTYRKGKFLDRAVSAFLDGAESAGAQIEKIYLVDQDIKYCDNCRGCTQAPIDVPLGVCHIHDDAEKLIKKIEEANGLILASPYNMGTVTAITKTFFERCAPFIFWPFGELRPPQARRKVDTKRFAVIFTSCTMPAFIGKIIAPNVHRLMIKMAKGFGFGTISTKQLGFVPCTVNPSPSDDQLFKLKIAGKKWAELYANKNQ